MPIAFLLTMLYYRYCYYQGRKRVMGGFTAIAYGMLFNVFGILFIRSSRLLDDGRTTAIPEEPHREEPTT